MRQFNRKFVLAVALVCVLPTAMLKAQDTLTVSLSKALEIAMSESPTIKVANKEIERVDYSKKEKFAALFPNISAAGSYQRALKKQRVFFSIPGMPSNPDGFEMGQDNTFNAGLTASLPIIYPTLWASLEMTETDAKLALESARSSKLSLVNQVTKAYYTILLTQDQYNVFKRSYQNTVENARIISNKFKQGTVSEFEWIRADVSVKNANSNLVSAESVVNMSKLQLKMLMGVDMFTGLKVDGKLDDFQKNMYGDVLMIDTTSLTKNTDLNQFDLKTKQLDHALKIQKASWWPTLAASFNYAYMSMANDGVDLRWFPTSTAALQLSIPIFQGGARVFKEKQLKIQQDQLKDQRDNLRRSLEMQAISYLDNIKKAIEKIESNKDGLRQAEKAVSISKKMYEVGSSTYLDLSNAELAYIQAGLMYNQSIFDYLSAKSDLEKLLGKDSK
ncbi:MAG: TolC family protein [Paludibacter sp.]|nr:TolC family protein [Paludibacter sp.]